MASRHETLRGSEDHLTRGKSCLQADGRQKAQNERKILSGLSHILNAASSARDVPTIRWVTLGLDRLCQPDRGVEQLKMNVLLTTVHLPE